jgi:hypothetical protein
VLVAVVLELLAQMLQLYLPMVVMGLLHLLLARQLQELAVAVAQLVKILEHKLELVELAVAVQVLIGQDQDL